MIWTGLLLGVLALPILGIEVVRYRRGVRFDPFFFFSMWFLMSYAVAPLAIALGGDPFILPGMPDSFARSDSFLALLAVYGGYAFAFAGYQLPLRWRDRPRLVYRWRLQKGLSVLLLLSMVGIALAALAVFVTRYGGLSFVMENVSGIRSGRVGRDTLAAAARLLVDFADIATWIVFAIVVFRRSRGEAVGLPSFVGLIGLTTIVFAHRLLTGGRGGLFFTLVMFLMIWAFMSRRIPWRALAVIAPVALFVIVFGKTVLFQTFFMGWDAVVSGISDYWSGRSWIDGSALVLREFSHPFLSLRQAIDAAGSEATLRWYADYPLGVLFYLNAFELGMPATVTYVNSSFLIGRFESFVPPGLLGGFWYSAALPGVLIGMFAYGLLGRLLVDAFHGLTTEPAGVPVYLYIGFMYGSFVFNGDPRVYVMKLAAFGMFLLGYVLVGNRVYVARPRIEGRPGSRLEPGEA